MGTAADLVQQFDAAFNARRLDRLADIMAPDVELVSPRGRARGHEEVGGLLDAGFEMFPDLVVEPIQLVEDGVSAAVQQRFTAERLAACELVMVDTQAGRISSWRTYYDQLPVLVAAGLAPPPSGGSVDLFRHAGPAGTAAAGADPAALGLRLIELIDACATDFGEVFAADAVFVHPSATVAGSAGLAGLLAPYREAFPDGRHTVNRVITGDGFAAVEGIWAGAHSGPLRTPQGAVPATGRRVTAPFAVLVRAAGHAIGTVYLHTDQISFATQLGLLSAPA
jgi:predicted ester cyclase/ketosteroid isomerase-like protein